MSLVFQNIDPPPPSPPGDCVPPAFVGGGGHTRRAERGVGGQYFGRRETQDCPLTVIISLRPLPSVTACVIDTSGKFVVNLLSLSPRSIRRSRERHEHPSCSKFFTGINDTNSRIVSYNNLLARLKHSLYLATITIHHFFLITHIQANKNISFRKKYSSSRWRLCRSSNRQLLAARIDSCSPVTRPLADPAVS